MTAITIPRQYDNLTGLKPELGSGCQLPGAFRAGNFFPPKSSGTNVFLKEILAFVRLEFYRQNSSVEPHTPSCQGTALHQLTAIISSISDAGISIQRLKPLLNKDFVSGL